MRLVKNHINEKFTEDSDPIKDIGIGIFSKKTFKTPIELYDWLSEVLPAIIHTKSIPKDILNDPHPSGYYIHRKYYEDINHYIFKYLSVENNYRIPYDVQEFRNFLKKKYPYLPTKNWKKNHYKVNEKFIEDSDPIQDMGIGSLRYYEKRKHEVGTTTYGEMHEKYFSDYTFDYDDRDMGWILYHFLFYFCEEKLDIKLTLDKLFKNDKSRMEPDIKECMQIISDTLKKHFYVDIGPYLETYLEHVSESINEKFSENGDPIDNMDIGIKSLLKKKYIEMGRMSEAEIYDLYFRPFMIKEWTALGMVLYLILKYITEKDLQFQDAFETALFNLNYHRRESEILKAVREKMADVLEKHFRIIVNSDIINIVNEKFTENSDPIADMNIGMIHDIKLWMKSIDEPFKNKDNALEWSAGYGKLDFVEYLLVAGADVHTYDDSALRLASNNGHTEVVKVLLAAGADVHANNDWALRWASDKGHTEVVKVLLAAGADVHAHDDGALHWASKNGHTEVVKVLKDHIAKEKRKKVKESVNEKFTEDTDAIHDMGIGMDHLIKKWIEDELYMDYKAQKEYLLSICVAHNKFDFVKYLVEQGVNVKGKYGSDALQTAAAYGYLDIVKYLIDQGADPLEKDSFALRWAARNGHYEIVKILLDAGADPHARGNYALKMARIYGHKNIIKLLLAYSSYSSNNKLVREHIDEKFTEDSDPIADMNIGMMHEIKLWMKSINQPFKNKDDALVYCAGFGKLDFVEYLLAAGANVHANNDHALLWASGNGHTGVVKVLLAAGADVHANNDWALQWASGNGHTEVVKVLKDHIAKEKRKKVKESVNEKFTEDSDPIADMNIGMIHQIKLWMKSINQPFKDKDNALECSAGFGKLDFVEYLLAAGADVHANNDWALQWASVNGHTEVVKPLLAAGANVHADNDHALKWASVNGHTEVVKVLKDHIAKEKRKKVKESVNEKFTEDSDPIHDLGIGGISFEEKRKETIGAEYLKSSEWLDYLRSLIGKTISGDFGKKGIKTFKICHYESYNRGTRLNFYDEDDNLYLVQPDKRYIIR